jgi:dynein heavy chain
MRKNVYTTPKSYLSFIALYKDLYNTKWKGIDVDQTNIESGLKKLLEAGIGVSQMKEQLKEEDKKL